VGASGLLVPGEVGQQASIKVYGLPAHHYSNVEIVFRAFRFQFKIREQIIERMEWIKGGVRGVRPLRALLCSPLKHCVSFLFDLQERIIKIVIIHFATDSPLHDLFFCFLAETA